MSSCFLAKPARPGARLELKRGNGILEVTQIPTRPNVIRTELNLISQERQENATSNENYIEQREQPLSREAGLA